ncbi:TPA: peptide deformylase [Enterococcus faecium]|nr:peptide deformylase [Neobacillus mesonae]HDT7699229.1 peptide deformylase [Enterococcus faecium]
MTIRDIVPFGDPILRKKAKEVDVLTPKLQRLLDDMAQTLYASEGRAGLAAPQVGFLRRLIVLDCGNGLIELINPEIIEVKGEQYGPEGCLSFPGYYGMVKRGQYIKYRTQNRQGEWVEKEAEDFEARCIQHEIDHLNGVLYIDHVLEPHLIHEITGQHMNVMDAIRIANG